MNRVLCSFYLLAFSIILIVAGCSGGNPEKPDTKANQETYSGFFPGRPGKNVTGIYVYADLMLPDPVYCLAFTTSPSIIAEIIAKYNLKAEKNSDYLEPYNKYFNDFSWWSADERKKSKFYKQTDDQKEVCYQLWYNEATGKCQVLIIYM